VTRRSKKRIALPIGSGSVQAISKPSMRAMREPCGVSMEANCWDAPTILSNTDLSLFHRLTAYPRVYP
jgi:hypothetical protein